MKLVAPLEEIDDWDPDREVSVSCGNFRSYQMLYLKAMNEIMQSTASLLPL